MPGNFYTNVIQRDARFKSTQPIKDVDLLEPGFRTKADAVIAAAKSAGIELVITETYRSSERQQQLFSEGKTQLKMAGVHHYGLACDFAKIIGGRLSWDGDWTFLCQLAAANGVVAGGDWGEPNKPHTFRDWDHLQGITLTQQTALFAGNGIQTGTVSVRPPPSRP